MLCTVWLQSNKWGAIQLLLIDLFKNVVQVVILQKKCNQHNTYHLMLIENMQFIGAKWINL